MNAINTSKLVFVLCLTATSSAWALTIDPPKCGSNRGSVFVEGDANAGFVAALVSVSGCYTLASSAGSADYIMRYGPLSAAQFEAGLVSFNSSSTTQPADLGRNLRGRLSRLSHMYIEVVRQGSQQRAALGFGKNNRSDVEYSNWPMSGEQRAATKKANGNKKSRIVAGALVNAYFEIAKPGSNAALNKTAASRNQDRSPAARAREKATDEHWEKFYNSKQLRPAPGGVTEGTAAQKSKDNVAVSLTPNLANSTQNVIEVKTLGTFGRTMFVFDEADTEQVLTTLNKFQSWVDTSNKNDITNVEKELFVLRFRMARIGKFGLNDKKFYAEGRIVVFGFRADEAGQYTLRLSNQVGGGCISYPDVHGADCTPEKGRGGNMSAADVATAIELLGNLSALNSQGNKADLLQ